MGQGLYTKVAQVVAQAFGVALDRADHRDADRQGAQHLGHGGFFGADMNGMAAYNAALAIRERLVEFCVRTYGCGAEEVVFEAGTVTAGTEVMAWETLCRRAYMARISLSSTGFYATPDRI
jgi:xanthine dehydrogenase large subunit